MNYRSTISGKGHPASRHFVQNRAKREQVRSRIQFFPSRLLRRHVSHCAYRGAGACQQSVLSSRLRRRDTNTLGDRSKLRQAEIEDFGVALLGHEEVCWLDVSMDYPLGVCCPERLGNLNRKFQRLVERKRLAGNVVLQGLAVEKLHGNEMLAALFADVVHGADVRVVQ